MRWILAATATCSLAAPLVPSAPAQAQDSVIITDPFMVETRPGPWERPQRASGFKPTRVRPDTRAVRIQLRTLGCRRVNRVRVVRNRRAIVITVIYDSLIPTAPYYVPCPPPGSAIRKVSLKGKLGHRSIKDGSRKPPKVRYPAPR
ncbi:MAG: hypothetical protein WKF94_02310 [Solirubrobacteraceae bacterium]